MIPSPGLLNISRYEKRTLKNELTSCRDIKTLWYKKINSLRRKVSQAVDLHIGYFAIQGLNTKI